MPESKLNSPSDLPPLGAVEAFVAVARSGSFSEAAERIGLSTSALSRRVKLLEEHVGERMFDRGKSRVRITAAGRLYLNAAEKALDLLANAKTEALAIAKSSLTVTMPHFFVDTFLAANIADFEAKNPDIVLNVDTSPQVADMRIDAFDLAVRYGVGDWPSVKSERIFMNVGGPACAPKLVNGLDLPRRIEALSKHTLLHFSQEPKGWARYFEVTGFKGMRGASDRFFDDGNLLYSAACQGLGIALIDNVMAKPLLDSGALVKLFNEDVTTGDGFHFVFAPGAENNPAVRRFCDWLISLDKIQLLRQRVDKQALSA